MTRPFLAVVSLSVAFTLAGSAAEGAKPSLAQPPRKKALVELYTSQG